MSDFIAGVLAVLLVVALVFVFAALGGTIIWLLWPIAIPAVFPGLVASGMLAGKLSW